MNQLELLQSISKYLARFREEVKILNANREFNINIQAENIMVNILNMVYDLALKNMNYEMSGNYAAIDLLDEGSSKVSFQITSDSSTAKVKECIEKYFRRGIYKNAKGLFVFILTEKHGRYPSDTIAEKIKTEIDLLVKKRDIPGPSSLNFTFTPSKNILDRSDLYRKLNQDNDIDKFRMVENFLRKSFGDLHIRHSLRSYHEGLKNMLYDPVMGDENGMTLDQVYIEPPFSILRSCLKNKSPLAASENEKFLEAGRSYKVEQFIHDVLSQKSEIDIKPTQNLILVLGYPGQGKSSFCKKFLNNYVLQDRTKHKPVFYFQLRNIRQATEFIHNPIAVLFDEACRITGLDLTRNEFYRSLLILDGLDELYMKDNLRMDDIDRLCIEFVRELERNTEMQIILTSRYGYVDDEKLARERLIIIQLSSFLLDDQKKWLSDYTRFHPETWLTEEKLDAFHKDTDLNHIRELISQPILLLMIASINEEIDQNANKSRIYSQLFSELIERRYAREGQLEIFRNVTKEDLIQLIREVAFAIFTSGNEYITKSDLLKLGATKKFLSLMPEDSFKESIKGVLISFYFKEKERSKEDEYDDKSNYAIEFLHKSLREFMTAEKIFYNLTEGFLEKRKNGKYMIDDFRSSLSLLSGMFSAKPLTLELIKHLHEIPLNTGFNDEQELIDRMLYFLHDFMLNDFLIEFRTGVDQFPISSAQNIFEGTWRIVSIFGPKKNYFVTETIKKRVLLYLRSIDRELDPLYESFDLSYQYLSGLRIENINFNSFIFNGTNFTSCYFQSVSFNFSVFRNTSFSRSTFLSCNMRSCRSYDSHFNLIFCTDLTVENCKFIKVNFEKARFLSVRFQPSLLIRYQYLPDEEPNINDGLNFMTDCNFQDAEMKEGTLNELISIYPEIKMQRIGKIIGQ